MGKTQILFLSGLGFVTTENLMVSAKLARARASVHVMPSMLVYNSLHRNTICSRKCDGLCHSPNVHLKAIVKVHTPMRLHVGANAHISLSIHKKTHK